VATLWLRPKVDLSATDGGPVVSASLLVLVALIVLVIAAQFVPLGSLLPSVRGQ
jgi:hypothetical protein